MGAAIKKLSGVFKTVTSAVQGLKGGALKGLLQSVFSSASSLTKSLSPIAPKFFANLDSKIQAFAPKAMAAVDKGLAFAKDMTAKANTAVAGLAETYTTNIVPMGAMFADLKF